jgi:hypothetical protein
MEQKYLGERDYECHFHELLKAFNDKRYIRFDNCPLFLIYKPLSFPDIDKFIKQWNFLIKKNSVAEKFYFVACAEDEKDYDTSKQMGFDAITINPYTRMRHKSFFFTFCGKLIRRMFHVPVIINYSSTINYLTRKTDDREDVIPFILPNWDHSPRSAKSAIILHNSTPKLFAKHVEKVMNIIHGKKNKLIFLKSWNEWGEGNYIEPDIKWGRRYLEELKKHLF